jgi:UDPglucose--hexose-1-phosphate uridylyltransferase
LMSELRIDPICGRHVYIAEERAGRPFDYAEGAAAEAHEIEERSAYRPDCPFCPGNEAATPAAVAVVTDDAGQWRVRVVPNKYPAVSMAAGGDAAIRAAADSHFRPAIGVQEVIIESPSHVARFDALSLDQTTTVLATYRDRLRYWAADGRLRYGLVFKNSGFAAGASLEHVHSQIVSFPDIPPVAQAEFDGAMRYSASYGRCLFCDLAQRERTEGARVVGSADGYLAFCAYAGRQPYETWILPDQHQARFDELPDGELTRMALVLQDVLGRLSAVNERQGHRPAYNLILHSDSFDGAQGSAYHWHWELVPRTTHLAGLEWGAGAFINPVSPERAARDLREAIVPPPPRQSAAEGTAAR